jgi:hypothetical protein
MSTFLCVNSRLISCFCFVLFSEPVVEVIDKEVKTEQAEEEKKDTKCDGDKQEVKNKIILKSWGARKLKGPTG